MMWRTYYLAPLLLSLATPAYAATASADCAKLQQMTLDDTNKIKAADIAECTERGWDPPPAFVPDPASGQKGANAEGTGGYSVGTYQAPDAPPKTAGAPSSASGSVINFNLFLNILFNGSNAGSVTAGGANGGGSTCLLRDDTTGTYGALTPLPQKPKAAFSKQVACSAALPLTNYRITLASNPRGLVVTENNSPYVWRYNNSGATYALVGGAATAFPKHLCEEYRDAWGNKKRRRTALPADVPSTGFAPQAQMVTYNASTQAIALKVIHTEAASASDPFDAANLNEYYMVLPIRNGVPYVPLDDSHGQKCDLQADFYKPASALKSASISGDLVIESSLVPGCEEEAAVCAAQGSSLTPTSPTTCETSIANPSGPSCNGALQYLLFDHPNLLFPPSSTVNAIPFSDQRTAYMVSTNAGGSPVHLVGPSDMVLHLNQSAHQYTFAGGTMGLTNGQRLKMTGTAMVDMSNLVVTLTGGGEIDDASGSPVATFPANATMSIPAAALPITLQVGSDIIMPNDFAILTAPSTSVREALVPPK